MRPVFKSKGNTRFRPTSCFERFNTAGKPNGFLAAIFPASLSHHARKRKRVCLGRQGRWASSVRAHGPGGRGRQVCLHLRLAAASSACSPRPPSCSKCRSWAAGEPWKENLQIQSRTRKTTPGSASEMNAISG